MGKMTPWYQVGIIGHDGRELGLDEEGELAIRADVGGGLGWIMKGYVREGGKIDKNQKSHGGKTWYCTGDRAKKDKDGYFWFVGRDDDVSEVAEGRLPQVAWLPLTDSTCLWPIECRSSPAQATESAHSRSSLRSKSVLSSSHSLLVPHTTLTAHFDPGRSTPR